MFDDGYFFYTATTIDVTSDISLDMNPNEVHHSLMTPTSVSNSHTTTYANDTNQSLSTTSGNFF